MAEFQITDAEFASLRDQVIVVTGGSSGIGLATAQLLLSIGSHVVVGDLNPGPIEHANLTFVKTDATSWPDILALFSVAVAKHGHVNHVFANAGIAGINHFLQPSRDPSTGALREPVHNCFDINLRGCVNTAYAGFHHMNPASGGSVVCTASASSFQRFSGVDYATTKHAVLGFVRSITALAAEEGSKVRINAIAPSWTTTKLVTPELVEGAQLKSQSPEAVARSVAVLMADENRKGQMIYSIQGKFFEVEEAILLPAAAKCVGEDNEGEGFRRVKKWFAERRLNDAD